MRCKGPLLAQLSPTGFTDRWCFLLDLVAVIVVGVHQSFHTGAISGLPAVQRTFSLSHVYSLRDPYSTPWVTPSILTLCLKPSPIPLAGPLMLASGLWAMSPGFFEYFLPFRTRCYRPDLLPSCQSPGVGHFSKEFWSFTGNAGNQGPSVRHPPCSWGVCSQAPPLENQETSL